MINFFNFTKHKTYPGFFSYCFISKDIPHLYLLECSLMAKWINYNSIMIYWIRTSCYSIKKNKYLSFYLE